MTQDSSCCACELSFIGDNQTCAVQWLDQRHFHDLLTVVFSLGSLIGMAHSIPASRATAMHCVMIKLLCDFYDPRTYKGLCHHQFWVAKEATEHIIWIYLVLCPWFNHWQAQSQSADNYALFKYYDDNVTTAVHPLHTVVFDAVHQECIRKNYM